MRVRRRGRASDASETRSDIRALPPSAPYLIRACVAEDMLDVGKRLRHGESVLLDLGALSGPVKRRMLDACAGLVYGLMPQWHEQ
jgi:hypothetical protein